MGDEGVHTSTVHFHNNGDETAIERIESFGKKQVEFYRVFDKETGLVAFKNYLEDGYKLAKGIVKGN
jgi:hypothetical protein